MSNNKRENLKAYFKANCAPSAGHFANLIDGMLNFEEDGIVKSNDGTLSIKAVGKANNLLNFYASTGADNPAWLLQLNPGPAANVTLGFSIGNEMGQSRLFIDRKTGYIGIGTGSPKGKLDIAGVLCIGADSGAQSINFAKSGGDHHAPKITYYCGGGADTDPFKIFGAGPGGSRTINLFDHVNVNGGLTVKNLATLAGGLRVSGSATIQGNLEIGGVLRIGRYDGQNSIRFAGNDEGVIRHSYKTGGSDNALSIYGAGLAGNRELKLVGDVEVLGKLHIKGNLINEVVMVNKNTPEEIDMKDMGAGNHIRLSSRSLYFTKRYLDTELRIVYSDNIDISALHYKNKTLKLTIGVDDSPGSLIFADIYEFDFVMLKNPVNMFGYLKGIKPGHHKIYVTFFALDSEKPKGKLVFGDKQNPVNWTMEVQEVFK